MRFFAVKSLPLFLTMSLMVLSSTAADAACSCKSGRWVTLGVNTAGYNAAEGSRTFQEAKQFDGARGMSYNPQRMQCSLCFGSNWRFTLTFGSLAATPPIGPETQRTLHLLRVVAHCARVIELFGFLKCSITLSCIVTGSIYTECDPTA